MEMETITKITAILGAAFGLLGAVLGIMNTWKAYIRDRPRIKVKVIDVRDGRRSLIGIQATNLSPFPITVFQIGFQVLPSVDGEPRHILPVHEITGDPLPVRLESRTTYATAIRPDAAKAIRIKTPIRAFIKTGCDITFTSDKIVFWPDENKNTFTRLE